MLKDEIIQKSNLMQRQLTTMEVMEMMIGKIDELLYVVGQPRQVVFDDIMMNKLSEQFTKIVMGSGKLIDLGVMTQREVRKVVEEKMKQPEFWVDIASDIKTKELLEGIFNDKTTSKAKRS